MDKSLTTIHKTTDYDKFNLKFGNRPIDNAHVKKIMRSMTEEFINVPIAVNKRYEIVDGQHRFTAAKALGLPIFYRFATENLLSIRRMNQNTKNWTINDFLASYVAIESREPGNIGPYTQFKWFKEATNFIFMGTSFSVNITNMALQNAINRRCSVTIIDPKPINLNIPGVKYLEMTAQNYISSI